jgi:hypothetical protein
MAFLKTQDTQLVPGFGPEETAALIQASHNPGSPLLAQLIRGGQDRIRQIDDAVREEVPRGTVAPREAVPSKPVPSTAELLRRIDALKPVQNEPPKTSRPVIPVEAITVHSKDGDELKYRDKKTGKIYDNDPND